MRFVILARFRGVLLRIAAKCLTLASKVRSH
jgi:hypothetical protein